MYRKVYVEITNICNRKCSFCPGTIRKSAIMQKSQFQHILRELQDVTRYLYFHIMGEPLTHPELTTFIGMANDAGYHVTITTNGTLLDKHGQALIDAGVYKVNLSIHSFEDGTVEDFLAYINQCMLFADRASKAGVLVVLRLWNQGFDNGRNDDIEALLKQYFGNQWHYGNRGITIQPNLYLEYDQRFSWPDMQAEDQGNEVFCYGLKDQFGILCDGTVVPCCLDREGVIALGNIFEDNIHDILSSERAKLMLHGFRERKAVEELCCKCGYARRFTKKS